AWRNLVCRYDDGHRRMLNFEPRGSGMMCSVLLLPPERLGSDFAVIIREQDEYVPMCGHCIGRGHHGGGHRHCAGRRAPATRVRRDPRAGLVTVEVGVRGEGVGSVGFDNVESFLLKDGPAQFRPPAACRSIPCPLAVSLRRTWGVHYSATAVDRLSSNDIL